MKRIRTAATILCLLLFLPGCCCLHLNKKDAPPQPQQDNAAIAAFLEEQGDELTAAVESAFAETTGLTCVSQVWAEGAGIVIRIDIDQLDVVEPSAKAFYQESFGGLQPAVNSALEAMQTQLPETKFLQVLLCEGDGDLICDIIAGEK